MAKFVLLDQGALRSTSLSSRIAEDPDVQFVVPDIALSEMSIKRDVERTMRLSLSTLQPVVDRCWAALSVDELADVERRQGHPLAFNQLISDRSTMLVRVLIAGPEAPDYRAVADRICDTAAAHKTLFDPEDDKRKMINLVGVFKAEMRDDRLRGLRAGRYTEEEKLGMVLWIVSAMKQVGPAFDTDVGRRLLFVLLLRIMMWGETEGLENTYPAKVMNDSIDMEFVVMASYFDEIMSRDNRVRQLDRQLRNVIDTALTERMMTAAYETGFRVTP